MHRIFIHHRSPHHSSHSGYAKLLAYIDGKVIDGKEAKVPYKLSKYFSSRKSNKAGNYDSSSVNKDLELFKTLQGHANENTIIHYLNAERDIRYNLKFKKKSSAVKFVATFHKPPSVLKDRITNTKYLKKLDAAICVGENQVSFIKDWLGLDNVVYIPHGVDTDFFVPDATAQKEHSILVVGQHLRDFEMINKTIPKFLDYDKSLKIIVVGIPSALKKVIEHNSVVKKSGVDDQHLKRLYQTSKLLFLPLEDVTACNSILEAMACGLPIVTNKVGGNETYLEGTQSCFENDLDLLVEEVIRLLKDDTLQKEKGQRLREKAMEYDWKTIAQQIEDFHKKILSI
jgi:glycosyltransferase involved in cell wall biosynthesis